MQFRLKNQVATYTPSRDQHSIQTYVFFENNKYGNNILFYDV